MFGIEIKYMIRSFLRKRLSLVSDACLWPIITGGILFLLYVGIRIASFESFRIPSASMVPTISPGDYILVNKWIFGPRIYNVFGDFETRKVNVYRLPGISKIKRNDVIVFNFPYSDKSDSIHFNFNEYYVKRCIAIPGDTLEIINGFYRTKGVDIPLGNQEGQVLLSIQKSLSSYNSRDAFPKKSKLDWTIKEFGPLYIPSKGQSVSMDSTNWEIYHKLIEWELGKRTNVLENQVFLSDSIIYSYEFQENYYFVGGDNIRNSEDSRFWGLLPESFIVGKATRIIKSIDPYDGHFRWNRFWMKIE